MTTAFRSVLLFSLLCFLTVGVAWGQSNQNIPADGDFVQSFGIDSINLQDLTVQLKIPVFSKPGFFYEFIGVSNCASALDLSSHLGVYCGLNTIKANNRNNGDSYANATAGFWPLKWDSLVTAPCLLDGTGTKSTFTGLYIVDPSGTSHYLPASLKVVTESGGTACIVNLDGYTYSTGIHVVTQTQPAGYSPLDFPVITLPNGSQPSRNMTGISTAYFTDTFGNQTSYAYSGTGTFTDIYGVNSITDTGNVPLTATYHDTGGTAHSISQVMTAKTFKTNFGCVSPNPIDETVSGTALTEVDYPDGHNLFLTYEATAGGITGRINQITYRTGGTASYTYGTTSCTSLIPASVTRTTADGVTTYTFALNGTHGTKTTVLDPGKNQTVYYFQGTDANGLPVQGTPLTLTEVQVYQNTGTLASPVNTLLSTTIYCYNGNSTNCPTTQAGYSITEKDTYTAPGSKATYSRVKQLFDSYGNVTSVARYSAFVAIGGGTADNTTTITYGSWNGSNCVAVGSGIVNKPCRIQTTDSASHILSDELHNYTAKGFPANVSHWNGSTWITSYASVNAVNGTVANTTNPLGQVTNYSYAATGSGGCNAILPTGTSTTLGSTTLTTGATWDTGCNMGKLMSFTDANGNTSNFTYDLLGRPYSQTDPSGLYELDERYPSATSSTLTDSTYFTTTNTVDGLGRPIRSQTTDGASYDTVSTAYAFTTGTNPQWQVSTSQPCITTLGADCTKNHFGILDPLGRSVSSSTTSNETVASAFNQNDASTTLSPAPSGENNKTVQTEYDGLGRVISTCAIQTTGGTACGQVDGNSGILTTFAYSYGAGTSTVTATRGSQVHTTVYDALGRLKSVTTPEAGTTTYTYDTASASCGSVSDPGTMVESVDNAGVRICYNHDNLGRLTEYQTPTGAGGCYDFIYGDQWGGMPLTNSKNRLAEGVIDLNCNGGHDIDEIFQYDADGRTTDLWETTPHSGGQYHTQASYAVNGQLSSISGVPGILTYTVTLDSNGRPDSSKYGTNVVGSNVVYNGAGQPTEIDYQSTDKDTYTFDSNTGSMTGWTFKVGTPTETGALTWNPNGTLKKLVITDGFNSGGTQTCHYNPTDASGSGYDDVGRLVGINCGTPWTQTYSYDQYNNFSKSGTTNWNPGYSATNNHITGAGYDSDGQVTYDLNNSYAWDGYHKMITANSGSSLGSCGSAGVTCVTYDALGRPVEKNVSGTITELLYSPIGLTGIMSGQTANHFRVPIPGGSQIDFTPSGGWNVSHLDWLGSARIISGLTGHTATTDQAYSPYGETYASFGTTGRLNFTGDFQDLYSGLYDTPNREFDTSSGSRWLSPDPARASWNAYSYPGNPNSMIDPSGLAKEPITSEDGIGGSWFLGFSGFGNFGGNCSVDGADFSCAGATQIANSGNATVDLNAMARSSATGLAHSASWNLGQSTLWNNQIWVPTGVDGGYAPLSTPAGNGLFTTNGPPLNPVRKDKTQKGHYQRKGPYKNIVPTWISTLLGMAAPFRDGADNSWEDSFIADSSEWNVTVYEDGRMLFKGPNSEWDFLFVDAPPEPGAMFMFMLFPPPSQLQRQVDTPQEHQF